MAGHNRLAGAAGALAQTAVTGQCLLQAGVFAGYLRGWVGNWLGLQQRLVKLAGPESSMRGVLPGWGKTRGVQGVDGSQSLCRRGRCVSAAKLLAAGFAGLPLGLHVCWAGPLVTRGSEKISCHGLDRISSHYPCL